MRYIANTFSLAMLAGLAPRSEDLPPPRAQLGVELLSLASARELAKGAIPAVGHEATAKIFSQILGLPVEASRRSIRLVRGDTLLWGQYSGPRLSERAARLPEGASILWYEVAVL